MTLVVVHAAFRVLRSDEEIADALINVGEILLATRAEILRETFRGAFLTLLEDANVEAADEQMRDEKRRLAEIFVYKRLPRIVECIMKVGAYSGDDLCDALFALARNGELLNALDARQMENVFLNVLNESKFAEFIGDEKLAEIVNLRYVRRVLSNKNSCNFSFSASMS